MSIQLKGNDESTFANDVTVGGLDFGATTTANGVYLASNGSVYAQREAGNNNSVFAAWNGTDQTCVINASGSATYAGDLSVTGNAAFTNSQIAFGPGGVAAFAGGNIELNSDGSASFSGNVTAPNTFLALDTGGTLDVKERIQNTQAILYRLKAALIQPDADANQLRTRLLEALDILTSDGDES
jgi:hypothetical protein